MAEKQAIHGNVDEIDAGDELISWETWNFPKHERSKTWYLIAAVIGVALIVYAILTANFLFAIIILMMGIVVLINNLRQPERIMVYITTLGVVVGNEFHSYKEIKDFSIVYEPPEIKILYLDFVSAWHPLIVIPLEDINPNEVRSCLLPYAFENIEREEEALTDLVGRLYKL